MFTGLVECSAEIVDVLPEPPGKRLIVRAASIAKSAQIGDSIALNGCCLTVVDIGADWLAFQAGPETLSRTNLGELAIDSHLNVERSLKVGDRLGGHYVTGHVDGVGTLESRQDDRDWSVFWFKAAVNLTRQMASKGSIAVDGVSLTLNAVEAERFSVALIPHTLAMTTLGMLSIGSCVNLETDLLAKYVERQLETRAGK